MSESKLYHKPEIFKQFPNLVAALSTRHGGVSPSPYESLNLGLYTEDDFRNVRENRVRFFEALGFTEGDVVGLYQKHEDWVLWAFEPKQYVGYDAIISKEKNMLLTITIADCVPILVYDSENEALGAVHAGWRGTVKEIVRKTLERMNRKFGTDGKDCFAYVGTCIDECSFEVGEKVAAKFEDEFKRFDEFKQKFFVDLKMANKAQLMNFGIPESQIEVSPFSTVLNNEDYFSYRKEGGTTGRGLAVIGMRS